MHNTNLSRLLSVDNDAALDALISGLPAFDAGMAQQAETRQSQLTKPPGSLGRLEEIANWMCGWQGTLTPRADKAYTLIFAGNHGVTAQGVSAFPAEVTAQMVANFNGGGAAINQLCKALPSTLRVIPLSLDHPTADISQQPAMTSEEYGQAFQVGVNAVPKDADVLVLGEMGIGNTTIAAAIAYMVARKMTDFPATTAADWVGKGTGVASDGMARKITAIETAYSKHHADTKGAVSLLTCIGGREIVALSGAIAAARFHSIPVILDGYVVTAAAAALALSAPQWLEHCIAGHLSVEPGHGKLLNILGKQPLLDLHMRLGEGSGAQLALAIVRAALATFNGMATFEEAAVSGKTARKDAQHG